MRFWEILLFCLALSLDVFAASVCVGAVLGKIRPGRLAVMSLIFCAFQTGMLALGQLLAKFPRFSSAYSQWDPLCRGLAALIFLALAVYFVVRALQHRDIFEHVSEINYKSITITAVITGLDALLVGIGAGFLDAFRVSSLVTLFFITAVCAVAGVTMGYHFGYRQKTVAYWIGGALFLAAGVDVFAQYLF